MIAVNPTRGLGAVLLATTSLCVSCGPSHGLRAQAPTIDTGQAKCRVAGQDNPLVTEWPASEKANLELRLREGGVAVAYSGCELRIVPGCRLGGSYAWHRTTPATDVFEMRSVDDLYAKLPIGAVSLEGELSQGGQLRMQTTVAGQLRLASVSAPPTGPDCRYATHVVTAMSVGAFRLSKGANLGASAGVGTPVGGVGAGTEEEQSLLREAGDPARCAEATDRASHPACSSPIQLFLSPLQTAPPASGAVAGPPATTAPPSPAQPAPAPSPPTPAPVAAPPPTTPGAPVPAPASPQAAPSQPSSTPAQPAAPAPVGEAPPPPSSDPTAPAPANEPWLPPAPPGPLAPGAVSTSTAAPPADEVQTVTIHLRSDDPEVTFALMAAGRALCTSPCSHTVRADDLVSVAELAEDAPEPMTLGDIRKYAATGGVEVEASPRSQAMFIGGFALTGVGGVSLLGGFMALFIGSSKEEPAAQVTGGILLGLSPAALVPGIIMVLTHGQDLEVRPAQGVQLSLGTGGLQGSF